jgi:hypothetical protein
VRGPEFSPLKVIIFIFLCNPASANKTVTVGSSAVIAVLSFYERLFGEVSTRTRAVRPQPYERVFGEVSTRTRAVRSQPLYLNPHIPPFGPEPSVTRVLSPLAQLPRWASCCHDVPSKYW